MDRGVPEGNGGREGDAYDLQDMWQHLLRGDTAIVLEDVARSGTELWGCGTVEGRKSLTVRILGGHSGV